VAFSFNMDLSIDNFYSGFLQCKPKDSVQFDIP
jgi:hypothetical protein